MFSTRRGKRSLADLFNGKSQLIIKHFMMAPAEGRLRRLFLRSRSCRGRLMHLRHHDVAFAAVARAPLDEIEAFKARRAGNFLSCRLMAATSIMISTCPSRRRTSPVAGLLQLRDDRRGDRGSVGPERVLQELLRRDLLHLFDLRAGWRGNIGRLYVPRHDAQGPQ